MTDREKSDEPPKIINDDILKGPRLAGHRISVVDIYDLLDAGETVESISEEAYPFLREEQVEAASEYIDENRDEIQKLWREQSD